MFFLFSGLLGFVDEDIGCFYMSVFLHSLFGPFCYLVTGSSYEHYELNEVDSIHFFFYKFISTLLSFLPREFFFVFFETILILDRS